MSNELKFRDVYHAVHTTLFGVELLMARPVGDTQPTTLSVQDLRRAVGEDSYRKAHSRLRPHSFFAVVKDGDLERETELVELRQFIMFCSNSGLPQFESVRDELFRIIDDVQEVGGHIGDNASIATMLAKKYGDDPLMLMLGGVADIRAHQIDMAKEQATIKASVEQHSKQLNIQNDQIAAIQGNADAESMWTVAGWLRAHRRPTDGEIAKNEGGVLLKLCRSQGVTLGPKVCHGEWAVNQYPFRVMQVWWPDCCKRYGWLPVKFEVTH